jgi:hypothetical protein
MHPGPVMTRYYRHRSLRYRPPGRSDSGANLVLGGVIALALIGSAAGGHAVASAIASPAPASCAVSAVACGQQLAAARGWTGAQWACLDRLWTRESGWNPYAANRHSSARGIPQDINGWADFAPGNVPSQIRWGLGYIAKRYGTPCAAEDHESNLGWY